ncbi:MAG: translation initiation factor IF-2 [Saprospiraceae bacterium]|nr:translation initiation factor IF-2 [Saprospiraceae bacterium]
MDRRLVKVAKELNVGTTTIVEYLTSKGYEIDNKPTAKIGDDMYLDLVKEFQGSIDVKEKADQLIIGNRPATKRDGEEEKSIFHRPEKVVESHVPSPPVVPPAPPLVVKEPEPEPDRVPEESKPKLKVLGKIDLDADKNRKKVTETPKVEEKQPKKQPDPEPVKEEEKAAIEPVKEKTEKEANAPGFDDLTEYAGPLEDMVRAETPTLKGLKIQGKIDIEKFDRAKKKPEEAPKVAPKSDATTLSQSEANKRKRKRKKVSSDQLAQSNRPANSGTGGQGGQGGQRSNQDPAKKPGVRPPENKEISKKEVEDKIKATMARLNVGTKNKRGKIRRDNRERIREKQELAMDHGDNNKLQVTEFISVSELASLMNVPVINVITTCMNVGVIVSINQRLDAEIIELVASEFGYEIEFIGADETIVEEEEIIDAPEDLVPRAPVVTVMGHVDHGKTSLLDYIRSANVVSGEAGGITQHIGAYEVIVNGKPITFLDTPGHEAFTAMRARGAKVTDVAVIIVAADDNIMPQTKEAISHAQAANVPIVFAINKIDKAGADPERIKNELAQLNFLVEEWGGKYQSQDISAKTGLNIDLLCEKIQLEAELLDLKANPKRNALGTVIEASLEKGRGYVAKMLVQSGTLKVGDMMVAGEYAGRVKAMFNERGKKVKDAGPATPVLVLGLSGAPQAGEIFKVTAEEGDAKILAAKRAQINREQATRAKKRISLDEIGRRLALGTFKELNLIVKADFDGSVEALSDALIKLSVETIQVNVIHKAVGQIIESDVLLASASDAIVIGFQVRPSTGARKLAEKEGVQVKLYSIIYEAIEEIKMAMEGMLEPTKEEKITSQVLIREVFKISKIGSVAGCFVEEGKISKNSMIRVIRDGIVIYPTREGVNGELSSLKRFKEDVKEVRNGFECGLTIKNFNDIKEGDIVEGYEITEVKQRLE